MWKVQIFNHLKSLVYKFFHSYFSIYEFLTWNEILWTQNYIVGKSWFQSTHIDNPNPMLEDLLVSYKYITYKYIVGKRTIYK